MGKDNSTHIHSKIDKDLEIATLANGCFWCTEAMFSRVKGIKSVIPGYSGGKTSNPSYEQVCTGKTGHAETIQIRYDPKIISFEKILDIFWHTHDPTTLNRQGNDVGTQYRSAIFYHDENQKNIAEKSKIELEKEGVFKNPIVTEISPFSNFYPAEDYHKEYYENNRNAPYCSFVIDPKIQKLFQKYGDKIKQEYL
jgi:peptide-methionine (S)-S-oxide reductase